MSRARGALIGLLVIGALAAVIAASTSESPMETLQKKVDELEQKLTTLQTKVNAIEQQVAKGPAAAPAAHPLEAEAQKAFTEMNAAVEAGNYLEAKAKWTDFQTKYAATQAARQASRLGAEIEVLGKAAPTDWFIEKWFQGESDVDLKSQKPTLVVFWETWCPHCRREVPRLEKVYTDFKGKGLQVLAVTKLTKNSTEEAVQEFIEQNHLSYPMAKENGQLSTYFNVSGVPAAAIVKDGKVIWRGHPARLSDEAIQKML